MVGRLYTFVTEREGGIYVSQQVSPSVDEAWQVFMERHQLAQDDEDLAPTPVDSVESVWCQSLVDAADVFWLVHIIETSRGQTTEAH